MANHGTDPRPRFGVMRERDRGDEGDLDHGRGLLPRPLRRLRPHLVVAEAGPGAASAGASSAATGAKVLDRVVAFGDEWMPNHVEVDELRGRMDRLGRDGRRGRAADSPRWASTRRPRRRTRWRPTTRSASAATCSSCRRFPAPRPRRASTSSRLDRGVPAAAANGRPARPARCSRRPASRDWPPSTPRAGPTWCRSPSPSTARDRDRGGPQAQAHDAAAAPGEHRGQPARERCSPTTTRTTGRSSGGRARTGWRGSPSPAPPSTGAPFRSRRALPPVLK